MGDSEDEYDRKRRDKFRGERAEASYRGPERVARPRDEWVERGFGDSWSRPRPRDYRPRDRGYSPGMEPTAKRMRHDYYGEGYYNHYTPYHQPPHREQSMSQMEGQQPPMMSFKSFLATQDDNISDSEAIEKYNDYKLEFQRQQLNEFFVAHKDDEWFRLKYHPEDSIRRKQEQAAALKRRLEVFIDLLNAGKIESTTVDCARTTDLLKLLDTVVIKLEGGSDDDLAALEQEYEEMEQKYREQKEKEAAAERAREARQAEAANQKEEGEIEAKIKVEKGVEHKKANETGQDQTMEAGQVEGDTKEDGEAPDDGKEEEEKNEDKGDKGDEEKGEERATEEPEKLDEEEPLKEAANGDAEMKESEQEENNHAETVEVKESDEKGEKKENGKKRKRSYSGSSRSSSSSSSSSESEDEEANKAKEKNENKEDEEEVEKDKDDKDKDEVHSISDDSKPEKPKALHKTTSIFLRNLAPTITKQEVEAVCARYEGFLRVALADPQPERRWLRRGWVTFKREANIKEICWNLNNIRLRECELGAIVNRDLSRRIRPVNGIMAHKQVVRSDIRIAARVTLHLDAKAGLWPDDGEKKEKTHQSFGLVSNNPVLHNITDYLIEEASAEEEELLGLEPSTENQEAVSTVDRDENLIRVLDRIILYLRVVHSVDYYNHCEYPNEDEMPNRCGILHARGPPPASKTDMTLFIGPPVEAKMSNFLPEKPKEEKDKNETKLIAMALKDVDSEVDKFVQANTRELAKDKWLCPLSGKKFKGPDFVRKHIFNKHAEKIEEVKKEVEFFNNYLKDPKRPMLAEAPQPKREEPQAYSHPGYGGGGGGGGGYGGGFGRPQPYYNQGFAPRSRGYAPRARGGPAGDFGRPIIHYRDLDAPREPEEFV
ncbi:serrate RNA effector molecule homolog isoform X2 [Cylas formicarius]|uniref:serrate RNA effector molecule homolog isoform X2 n=1 Tax=Cylas formicarius TaxID=197179 RepID=UPI002958B6F8|nr:serrate RNA effector molecule homolog isoform X2 [Cylas formicarius]